MASRNYHKNRTKERKKRQADARALDGLRARVRAYEGIGDRRAASMTADQCRNVIKYGKRRPFYPSPVLVGAGMAQEAGIAAMMLANDMLGRRAPLIVHAAPKADSERLRAVAIMRDGEVLERGFKSHWELRAALNPERHDHTKTIPGDIDGFITSLDRFVDRAKAQEVAFAAGQIRSMMRRDLLSSDIDW